MVAKFIRLKNLPFALLRYWSRSADVPLIREVSFLRVFSGFSGDPSLILFNILLTTTGPFDAPPSRFSGASTFPVSSASTSSSPAGAASGERGNARLLSVEAPESSFVP